MSEIIYRVQDKAGRGPFRPGFSRKWVELRDSDEKERRPCFEEFGKTAIIKVKIETTLGMNCGCGCRTLEQLRKWFSDSEMAKLRFVFGYFEVEMQVDKVIAESQYQLIFARRAPLNKNVRILYEAKPPLSNHP